MSNIPSTALSSALTPVQRATHDAARARQIQSKKEFHHHEEVQELDDTAINSVSDESQDKNGQQNPGNKKRKPLAEELLEISSLEAPPAPTHSLPSIPPPQLDISA